MPTAMRSSVALLLAIAAGCSSPSGPGPDASGDCNTLAQLGAPVTATFTSGNAPAPTGGTIVPGTYLLTAATYYGTMVASNVAETALVSAGSITAVLTDQSGGAVDRNNLAYMTNGTDLVETHTCPLTGVTTTVSFSATPTTLTLSYTVDGATRVGVYTLQ
jgi:hypothetical protein